MSATSPLFPDFCVIIEILKIKTTIAKEPFFLSLNIFDLLNTEARFFRLLTCNKIDLFFVKIQIVSGIFANDK